MMIELVDLGWGKENPAFRQLFTTQFIPDATPEQHRWWNELERVSTSPDNAARFMRIINEIDVTMLAPKVACPTLVLHSALDARVPVDEGRLVAGLAPGARFVPLESRNHILVEYEPAWQSWLEEVRALLSSGQAGDAAFASVTLRERAGGIDRAGARQCTDRRPARAQRKDREESHHKHFREARGRKPLAGDCAGPRRGFRLRKPLASLPGTVPPRFGAGQRLFGANQDRGLIHTLVSAPDNVNRRRRKCAARRIQRIKERRCKRSRTV